jgi:hypothetical protein
VASRVSVNHFEHAATVFNYLCCFSFFLKSLEKCVENLVELGPLINKCERKLRIYVVYCQNKPISEYIVSEHFNYFEEIGRKLNHKLQVRLTLTLEMRN